MSRNAFEIIDFQHLPGTACPCGVARRGLMDTPSVPYSLHLTDISVDAKVHYHKHTTETYFILDCDPDAALELDGQHIRVTPHTAITIHPGTRHRAVGKMKIVLVASPKFDPADEWFD
ncbi:MAG: cupin domain-containing protein [Pirellulaceae bacterium]